MKIYSNQNINSEDVIPFPDEVQTNASEWWFIYNADTKLVIEEPQQCSGFTTSPLTMVISDSESDIYKYIEDNNLILPDIDS